MDGAWEKFKRKWALDAMPKDFYLPRLAEAAWNDAAAEAALAAANAEDWQPIETAPKNGRPILVFGEFAGEITGPAGDPFIGVAIWRGDRTDYPGFEWSAENTDAYSGWWKPSHWMPLPPPPAAKGEIHA